MPASADWAYTFSKALDYVSSLHIAGPAPILVSGEMDLAQNPFDLRAEHGPSLFDARHRLVANGIYEMPGFRSSPRFVRAVLGGWQLNGIFTLSSPTPFTVYDSRNVWLQAPIPPVAGTFASRPDLVSNCADGPHTPQEWISASSFHRLNAITQAGQFGNEGRNVCRGAGLTNLDLSLVRNFKVTEAVGLQFRAESFNVMNHANFGRRAIHARLPPTIELRTRSEFSAESIVCQRRDLISSAAPRWSCHQRTSEAPAEMSGHARRGGGEYRSSDTASTRTQRLALSRR